MKFDGMNFRRRNDLGFRIARAGDEYRPRSYYPGGKHRMDLGPEDWDALRIPSNYVVFFRVREAKTVEKADGRVYYDPDSVTSSKILPLEGHGLTRMAYGVPRRQGYELLTTVYLAHDGRVYSALLRRPVFSGDLDKS